MSFFFSSSHMLIDYETGIKCCAVNPWAAANTLKCNLSLLRKDFQKNETDGSEFSCMAQKQGKTEMC